MPKPELVFVVGPNAAGKSSFIRTRINELDGCEIIMTDVYKSRSKAVFKEALAQQKDIVLETVFNDASFKDLVDQARHAGYHTSLIVLFLDSIQHSLERVAFRSIEQNGLMISGSNIRLNFNESFKNVAQYFFYFDQSDFVYTGITSMNKLIMSFSQSELIAYQANELVLVSAGTASAARAGAAKPKRRLLQRRAGRVNRSAQRKGKPAQPALLIYRVNLTKSRQRTGQSKQLCF